MPELPEVETIRRGLNKFIKSKKITNVQILCEKSFIGPKEVIENQEIESIERRGKAMLINLKNGITMMIHLRMTGQLIYRSIGTENGKKLAEMIKKGHFDGEIASEETFAGGHPTDSFFTELPNTQTRVVIEIDSGTLFFNDQRKFGFIKLIPTNEVSQDKFISKLAKEPWDISPDEFFANIKKHKNSCIKGVILDQTVIAGIGNIYADEALFASGIHPNTLAGTLTLEEVSKLLCNTCKIMDESINSGGSTMATYVRADGTKGDYLEKFAQVFHREGQPCKNCGSEIIKIRVAGRGTHICPNCQKMSESVPLAQKSTPIFSPKKGKLND